MEQIKRYFPELSAVQIEQYEALFPLYKEWNEKINVVSRKDFDNLYERHVLHALGIVKFMRFKDHTQILDLGTGGGFPGIPLAIFYPECHFHLIDSINKKLQVVRAVVNELGLKNVQVTHTRMEEHKETHDFVVSRAVMPLSDLARLTRQNISKESNNALPNGLICLKGGDLTHELMPFRKQVITFELSDVFKESFFETKKVVYLP
jgi:16S rRNA (guanine527-N7)-methyltransferase